MDFAILFSREFFEGSSELRVSCRNEGVSCWGFRAERNLGPVVSKTSGGSGGNVSAHHTSKFVAF